MAESETALQGDTFGVEPALAYRMLEFEKKWLKSARRGPKLAGVREEAIRQQFPDDFAGNAMAYHQTLNRLIDSPAAEAAEPMLIHQLRRLRDGERGFAP